MTGVGGRNMGSDQGFQDIECELAARFRDYLHSQAPHRYHIKRLDQPGQSGFAGKRADFLLLGENCPNVGLELKRLVRYDRRVEERTRRIVEGAVREARGNTELPEGYIVVLRSMPPEVPERRDRCGYARFLGELRVAFRTAKPGEPYKSGEFELWQVPIVGCQFSICAPSPRDEHVIRCELFRLLNEADKQLGFTSEIRTAGMRVVALVIAGDDSEPELASCFCQAFCPDGLGPEWRHDHTTHVFSMSIGVQGDAPYLSIAGQWAEDATKPRPEVFALTHDEAARYSAYANGICQPK